MNADLEESLKELGAEYRPVVDRLRAAREVEPGKRREEIARRTAWNRRGWTSLLAASVLVVLSFGIWQNGSQATDEPAAPARFGGSPSYGARDYHLTPEEMIATQRADGGWANDFLTRRNARVLGGIDDPRARIAYKKAMRNLRFSGLR